MRLFAAILEEVDRWTKKSKKKKKEEPTMKALHNINIPGRNYPKDTKFRVVDDAGVDIETGKYVGDPIDYKECGCLPDCGCKE